MNTTQHQSIQKHPSTRITEDRDDIFDSPFEMKSDRLRTESVFASEFDDEDDFDSKSVSSSSTGTRLQSERDVMRTIDDELDEDKIQTTQEVLEMKLESEIQIQNIETIQRVVEVESLKEDVESEFGLGEGLSFGGW